VTGRLVHRFVIPDRLLKQLIPVGGDADRVSLRRLLETMLVDDQAVYLSTADLRNSMRTVVMSFDHSGGHRWTWTSKAARGALKLRALHASGVVLMEVIPGGRRSSTQVALLDKARGTELRGVRLQGTDKVLNRNPEPFAPDLLLIEESYSSTSLIGFSLTAAAPSFREDTHRRCMLWRHPVIGETFLAAGVLGADSSRMELMVLRLADRKGALPDGRERLRLPDRGASTLIVAHDQYTICQAPQGLMVFGAEEKSK
jgi:hypothetical protein